MMTYQYPVAYQPSPHKAEPYQVVDKFNLVFATQLLLVDL